jgi:hypothetical protein
LVPKISKVKWSQVIYHFHFLESNDMVLDHIVILLFTYNFWITRRWTKLQL